MCQDRLRSLSLLSMEIKEANKIDMEELVNDLAEQKAR